MVLQRATGDALGLAVHRRRVEEGYAFFERGPDDLAARLLLLLAAHVEDLPGAETHNRDFHTALAQPAVLHLYPPSLFCGEKEPSGQPSMPAAAARNQSGRGRTSSVSGS